jgi:D-glycero-D-manno-heptose 1,7-bisphosphate phosphatase
VNVVPGAAVFLDRDGTLNEPTVVDGVSRPPTSVENLRLVPGASSACLALRAAGLLLICATNQPDIARGSTSPATVDALNDEVRRQLSLDRVLTCPHDDRHGCECRKPAPGLLLQGALEFGVDLSRSVMVGDSWRDVEAGRRAGCATVLIERGHSGAVVTAPDLRVTGLSAAVSWILEFSARASSVETA